MKYFFLLCLHLQQPMQSVAITIEDISSYVDQGEVYNIMW
jgi:hypothetical protein